MIETLLIFLLGLGVGGLGSMLGIGGGVLLIPMLTGLFGIGIKTAIGASIISVIATSCAAGAAYVERGLAHGRLAMVLETATTTGALAGGITAVMVRRVMRAWICLWISSGSLAFRVGGVHLVHRGSATVAAKEPLNAPNRW